MKKVVFQDSLTGQSFLVDVSNEQAETILWTDGQTYPLVKVEIKTGIEEVPPAVQQLPVSIAYTKRENLH